MKRASPSDTELKQIAKLKQSNTDQIREMAHLLQTVCPGSDSAPDLTMSVAFDMLALKREQESKESEQKRVRFDIPSNLEQSVYGAEDLMATVTPSCETVIEKKTEEMKPRVVPEVDLEATVVPTYEESTHLPIHGLDARNKEGSTSLHLAAKAGHMDVVVALLDGGADINARDSAGNTALSLASAAGHIGVVMYLIRKFRLKDSILTDSIFD